MAANTHQTGVSPEPSEVPRKGDGSSDAFKSEEARKEGEPFLGVQEDSSTEVPAPKLRLHLEDLSHDGTKVFLKHISDPRLAIKIGLSGIVKYLYSSPPCHASSPSSSRAKCRVHFDPCLPPTLSVTLILRDFSGVAYTTGSAADSNHKEIHFSLSYIAGTTRLDDPAAELVGVIVHELVHCYQHTTPVGSIDVPKPPGGLIEGIADFVRLRAGFVPPHWKRPRSPDDLPASWDRGYQQTAFFLEWLEDSKAGVGAIGMLNDRLLREGYVGENRGDHSGDENVDAREGKENRTEKGNGNEQNDDDDGPSPNPGFWNGLFGAGVLQLWDEYAEYIDRRKIGKTSN